MHAFGRQPGRALDGAPVQHERHRPERTTLYRLVQQHAASLIAHPEANPDAELPRRIKYEFEALLCPRRSRYVNRPGFRGGWLV